MAVNRSEAFVQELCKRSFLTLWTHPNPLGKKGRELCDVLIVCDPDVLIVSVKEVQLSGDVDGPTEWERWSRRAVDASAKQIYGAERFLSSVGAVTTASGTTITLPEAGERRTFRIAIALGGDRRIPIRAGDFGKGFVHVLDEVSTPVVLDELDTIVDLVEYFIGVESLTESTRVVVNGGVEDHGNFFRLL